MLKSGGLPCPWAFRAGIVCCEHKGKHARDLLRVGDLSEKGRRSASGPAHEGIGYAFSLDGLTWTKAKDPIFHISDEGADHRSQRTYTPSVIVNRRGRLRMCYSAKSADNVYAIGLAVQKRRRN